MFTTRNLSAYYYRFQIFYLKENIFKKCEWNILKLRGYVVKGSVYNITKNNGSGSICSGVTAIHVQ